MTRAIFILLFTFTIFASVMLAAHCYAPDECTVVDPTPTAARPVLRVEPTNTPADTATPGAPAAATEPPTTPAPSQQVQWLCWPDRFCTQVPGLTLAPSTPPAPTGYPYP